MRQLPKMLATIKQENEWLKKTVAEKKIDTVISDNRYGLWHEEVESIFITHQLLIKTGLGAAADRLLQVQNYKWINRFDKCLVPDFAGADNLAGELAHPVKMPRIPCEYIGPQSRMAKGLAPMEPNHVLVMLSGPEPQRSMLENKIKQLVSRGNKNFVIVRGLPNEKNKPGFGANVIVHNHLPAAALNLELCKAEMVICRSGYSSVMDLHATGVKALLVPTPGQTEQEYLAKYLREKGMYDWVEEKNVEGLKI